MESNRKLKALIIGATGATGRELTDLLLKSQFYSNVSVIVRRKIDRWEKLDENYKEKLKILFCDDFNNLSNDKDYLVSTFNDEFKYDTVFCCLGGRTKNGEAEFKKVDYDFVISSANLCEKFQIPHFSVISTKGANPSSYFMYFKVKGQADQQCLAKNIQYVSVLRPGAITDRDNDDRFGEKLLKFMPFISKINSVDLARAVVRDDLNYHFKKDEISNFKKIFNHEEILALKNQYS